MIYQDDLISGCLLYIAIQRDPLEQGAVKLDIDEWAYPSEMDYIIDYPLVGDKVFCFYDYVEEKYFWIGFVRNGRYVI